MPLSFEEQETLSEAINLLQEKLLPGAIQIIREADLFNDGEDEIDLDIDQLDIRTQRKPQSFVMEVRLAKILLCDFHMTICLIKLMLQNVNKRWTA